VIINSVESLGCIITILRERERERERERVSPKFAVKDSMLEVSVGAKPMFPVLAFDAMVTGASRISVNETTYFLFVKEAQCPNKSSRSLGNSLQSASGYRSHHSNTVCPR
jgi:hypothetical protein